MGHGPADFSLAVMEHARRGSALFESLSAKEVNVLKFPILRSVSGTVQSLEELAAHALLIVFLRQLDEHFSPRFRVEICPLNICVSYSLRNG